MKKEQTKRILVGIIVVLVVITIYLVYSKKFSNTETDLLTSSEGELSDERSVILAQEINLELKRIEAIKLDVDFLRGNLFRSLVDLSQKIPQEPIGKSNPFSPLRSGPSQSVLDSTTETE